MVLNYCLIEDKRDLYSSASYW